MKDIYNLSFSKFVFPFAAVFMIYAVDQQWLNLALNKTIQENLKYKHARDKHDIGILSTDQ